MRLRGCHLLAVAHHTRNSIKVFGMIDIRWVAGIRKADRITCVPESVPATYSASKYWEGISLLVAVGEEGNLTGTYGDH